MIDIRPLLAALDDPGKLGQILALSAMADELAQRDVRYAALAGALGELWPAIVRKNVREVRRGACKVAEECDRLSR